MNKILELREKRAKAWEAAKAFLDTKRGGDGLLSAEDTATYDKMEADVVRSAKRSTGWSVRLRLTLSCPSPPAAPSPISPAQL